MALLARRGGEGAPAEPLTGILERFGYTLNRLVPSPDGTRALVCSEAVLAGAPLLAVPLRSCWTAERARQCLPVARELDVAAVRNPKFELLQADDTWIVLHLLYERSLGDKAPVDRQAHLALIPEELDTMLAWSEEDLEFLAGSPWEKEVARRQAQIEADFQLLLQELGPESARRLHLDRQGYLWARHVLQQFGIHVLAPNGCPMTLLAPGLELLPADPAAQPTVSGVRVEFGDDLGLGTSLVVTAARDYDRGEGAGVAHAGLACANGRRLVGCGCILEPNRLDHVEVVISFVYAPPMRQVVRNLAMAFDWVSDLPAPQTGDSLTADLLDAWGPVEVVRDGADAVVRLTLRLTAARPLPEVDGLALLGLALLGDPGLLPSIVHEERGSSDVYGQAQCAVRGLRALRHTVVAALEGYPPPVAQGEEDVAPATSSRPSRRLSRGTFRITAMHLLRQQARRLLAAEREILSLTVKASDDSIAAPEQWLATAQAAGGTAAAELLATSAVEPDSATPLGRALAQLRGCTSCLNEVAARFTDLRTSGRLRPEDAEAPQEELQVLRACLAGSRLSDPGAAAVVPVQDSGDIAVRVHGAATQALFEAALAAQEWEAAAIDQGAASGSEVLPGLVSRATLRMRLWDITGAQQDFAEALALSPDSRDVRALALECAAARAASSDEVLGDFRSALDPGSSLEAALTVLRERLEALAFTRAKLPCAVRLPASLPVALGANWATDLETAVVAAAGADPTAQDNLADLIQLLVLHRPLTLLRSIALLGREAVKALLSCSALSVYLPKEGRLLARPEAASKVEARSAEAEATVDRLGEAQVFANLALWPLEGLVVAADFDPPAARGGFQPILYPAEDTRALIAGCTSRSQSRHVLDAHCGGGALGLVALKYFAERVTFADANPRALRFARFGVYLNGFAGKADFVAVDATVADPQLLGGPFDAVVAGLPFWPNPDGVITTMGPMFSHGDPAGEKVLAALIGRCARGLLKPRGWLAVASPVTTNPDGLARRLMSWAGSAEEQHGPTVPEVLADFRAVVLCGLAQPVKRLFGLLEATTALERDAYRAKLHALGLRTFAPAVVLLCACLGDEVARGEQRVAVHQAAPGFWSEDGQTTKEVQRAFDGLLGGVSVGALLSQQAVQPTGSYSENELLYAMDWDDAKLEGLDDMVPTALRLAAPKFFEASPWEQLKRKRRTTATRSNPNSKGCSWDDAMNLAVMGWSPPILCDVYWQETPKPEIRDRLPKEQIALVEVKGCRLPGPVERGLRRNLECSARYTFDGKPRQFVLASGGLDDGYDGPLAGTDVLIVPMLAGVYADAPLDALATEVLLLLQAVAAIIEAEQRYITVVLLTCAASGPPLLALADRPAAAVPVRGVARVARIELQTLPLLSLDTDALGPGDAGKELARQIARELEATDGTMEVAYRGGRRFAPRMRLSARNRIRAGQAAPRLTWGPDGGVAIITGGLGGLGLVTAEALIEAGVPCVVLASRSGHVAREGQGLEARLQALQTCGATVLLEVCDTSSEKQVVALLDRVRRLALGPIRIIVHAAGILDDKMFFRQDAGSMRRSFAPKADGAWYLHKHSLQDKIQSFVCYSSVASNYGNFGQANYAAANTYMDELCCWRVAIGLPACSVQWPGIKEVGMSAKMVEQDASSEFSVDLVTVKQVVKQVVAGSEIIEPMQAVCPSAQLAPKMRQHASMLEPLLEAFITGLRVVNGEVKARVIGTGEFVGIPGRKNTLVGDLVSLYAPPAA